jgi:hypothetical protein
LKHLRKPLNPRDETTDRIEALREIIDREAVGILIQWRKWFALPAAARETASFPLLVNNSHRADAHTLLTRIGLSR